MYQKLITLIKKITKLTDENFIEALTAKVDDQLELEEWRLNNENK
jgi:hypothetical protein|tara:strand:+ start:420 stop:554 length:135 start_codon:yes stop_codon:yes gene_type:complete